MPSVGRLNPLCFELNCRLADGVELSRNDLYHRALLRPTIKLFRLAVFRHHTTERGRVANCSVIEVRPIGQHHRAMKAIDQTRYHFINPHEPEHFPLPTSQIIA